MSEVAQDTSAWPFPVSTMRTAIGICKASQTPVAMPQPTNSLPSRIERGSGLRLIPAKCFRALAVAFAQAFAAVGPVGDLVAIRITPQAKLKRIELSATASSSIAHSSA